MLNLLAQCLAFGLVGLRIDGVGRFVIDLVDLNDLRLKGQLTAES